MRGMAFSLGWVLAAGVAAAPAAGAPLELVVDDDGVECPEAAFTHIQAAVNASPAGTVVRVCAGTYTEQVVVSQPLTLQGENGAVVKPVNVTPNTTSLFDGSPIAAILLVSDTTGAVIEGLTVDGASNGLPNCLANLVGVFYRNASGRAKRLAVRHVELGPGLEGCQAGLGIFAQSGGGGSSHVEVFDSSVHHFQKNGITVNEPGSVVRLRGNVVMGRGPGRGAAQNGIQIAFGAGGQILQNTVANLLWPGCVSPSNCPASATDVLVVDAVGVRVAGNTLGKSQGGILVVGDGVAVLDNNVHDTDVFDGIAVVGDSNQVTGNTITRSEQSAVYVEGDANTVSRNAVNEAPVGVWVFDGAGNVVTENRFWNTPVQTLGALEPARPSGGPSAAAGPFR
jgi:nitrous oxidase accessory protein NosD